MASSSSSKVHCATCFDKSVGIFKCQGCSQVFCQKHVIEHRDFLNHQLDEIVVERDNLHEVIVEHKDRQYDCHSLLMQIDKWETDAILKIQQTAEEPRQKIDKLVNSQKEMATKKLDDLAKKLKHAREDSDFVETDLATWSIIIEKLKHDISIISPLITINEDPADILISNIYVSKTMQYIEQDERFGELYGTVRTEENGHKAIHNGRTRGYVFLRGSREYSLGKHKIRFFVNMREPHHPDLRDSACGWYSDDSMISGNGLHSSADKPFRDFNGETRLEIELLLDCDNQKISYFNERTKITRDINVDIKRCPFPWQLLFFMYDTESCVQILSSHQLLNDNVI